ncbi:MAG TPA: porphobilinogen synthase, partial [Nitrospiria bacterium]|nr:porphobilinogen synthase [Nitrospiria bacterium]
MSFPEHRPRRLRESDALRKLTRETRLDPAQLIAPFFVTHGRGVRDEIGSMPGHFRLSTDRLLPEVEEVRKEGVVSLILFGIPEKKDELGSEAWNRSGVVQNAIREIKGRCPDLTVITDVCVDEYTSHGHCGVVENGKINNDRTLELL